ncbi:MAG TPA: ankyrin repeat domain-containing protein [Candidatus Wallbacteria bacterium]|nr:ankyrin repeat domain-containing protein [Candidatus Wallbacteria bacterium]
MKNRALNAALVLSAAAIFSAAALFTGAVEIFAKDKLKEKDRELFKNNRVASVTEYDVSIKNVKKVKKSFSKYDSKGLKTEITEYKPNGKTLEKRFEYSYDTNSNEINQSEYNIDGILKASKESSYDTKGVNLLKEVFFNEKNIVVKVRVFNYDSSDNVIEQITYGIDDNIESKNVLAYDSKGFKTVQATYDKSNKLSSKWLYKYDEKGNLSETVSQDASGNLTSKWVYSYNEKGLIDKITGYNSQNTAVTSKKLEYEFRAKPAEVQKIDIAKIYSGDGSGDCLPDYTDINAPPRKLLFINRVKTATAEEVDRMIDEGKFDLNYQGDNGWTALIAAASYGNAEAVKALLARGVNTNLKDGRGMTALDYAVKIKSKEVIKLLNGVKTENK